MFNRHADNRTDLTERQRWQEKSRRQNVRRLLSVGALVMFVAVAGIAFAWNAGKQSAQPLMVAGNTINVGKNADFQAALNLAKPGDTIVLEAGAEYVGAFRLPAKNGGQFITITSSKAAKLPADNQRVAPADAVNMPKIVSSGKNQPAIMTAENAHHFRFVGVEITVNKPEDDIWRLVFLGLPDDVPDAINKIPHHITFDRCYIHARADQTGRVRSGVTLNGRNLEVLNSYISGFRLKGDESQAIVAWDAPGPFRIINNYLEAAGENVLFGGATAHVGMNPADLEFRRNYLSKPMEWREQYTVKNLFELKDMRRAVIEENVMENCWVSAQNGSAIVLTPASLQSGDNARVEDIVFRSNVVRRAANGIAMTGKDWGDPKYPNIPVQNRSVRFENNLFTDISRQFGGGTNGRFLVVSSGAGPDNLSFNHNTVLQEGSAIMLDGGPLEGFAFTNNIILHNEYGIHGVGNRGGGIGTAGLANYMTKYVFRRNLLIGADSAKYPADNFFPATLNETQFVNAKNGNYRLSDNSRFRVKGTDDKEVGCDYQTLEQTAQKVISGRND